MELTTRAASMKAPLLADRGLIAALEGQARRSAIPVDVQADEVGRYPQEAEAGAAVYFCCLEALQNVAKYAGASRACRARKLGASHQPKITSTHSALPSASASAEDRNL